MGGAAGHETNNTVRTGLLTLGAHAQRGLLEEGHGDVTGEMCSENSPPRQDSEEGRVLACTMGCGTPPWAWA